MDTEGDVALLHRVSSEVVAALKENPRSQALFESIQKNVHILQPLAVSSDFDDVKYNGFRTAIYVASKLISKCLFEKPHDLPSVLRIMDLYLRTVFQTSQPGNNNLPGGDVDNSTILFTFLDALKDMRNDLNRIIGPFSGSLFAEDTAWRWGYIHYAMSLWSSNSLLDLFKKLTNREYARRRLVDMSFFANVDTILGVLRFPEQKALSWALSCLTSFTHSDVDRETVLLEVSSNFAIEVVTHPKVACVVQESAASEKRTVRCRLYSNKATPRASRKYLVFHVHGGGFVAGSPEGHECYLLDYARGLPGASILSVDYTLAPEDKFPAASQQVLDVYSFISSGSADVRRILGFEPQKILMTGDSCGALLVMSTLNIIVDIRRMYPGHGDLPRLPFAFVSVYGAFSIHTTLYPSLLAAIFDPVITPRNVLELASAYSPFPFQLSEEMDIERSDEFQRTLALESSPYYSPVNHSAINYSDFNDLRTVRLVLVTSSMCSRGDSNVTMAKLWNGPVSLIIIANEPHGFLHLNNVSKSATEATRTCIEQIRQCLAQ